MNYFESDREVVEINTDVVRFPLISHPSVAKIYLPVSQGHKKHDSGSYSKQSYSS
jgi:hypothetical protein